MSAYPELSSVPYIAPIEKTIRTKNIVKTFDSGVEIVKQKWLFPKRDFKLTYQKISNAEAKILWQFYIDHMGQAEYFSFFDPNSSEDYENEYVGTGDGSTTMFSLPSKGAVNRTLKLDNIIQSEITNWTFSSEDGSDGEDQCEFVTAPTLGQIILFTFTGRLKIRCRFNEDTLNYSTFYRILTDAGISLRGLLNLWELYQQIH